MTRAVFELVEGPGVSRWRTECVTCHRQETIAAEGQARNKLVRMGWSVHSNGASICPTCTKKARMAAAAQEKAQRETSMEVSKVVRIKPKRQEMAIADKRRINKELSQHYRDDGKGYRGKETDQTISVRLQVPMVWVSEIRQENFGDATAPIDVDKLARHIKALKTNVADLEKTITEAIDTLARYGSSIERLEDEISGLVE